MLADSNILIYAAEPADHVCKNFLSANNVTIASVTRIEVLGFPGYAALPSELQYELRKLLSSLVELQLSENVIKRAIALRQQRRMGIADAIVAGTALVYDLELATRNTDDFKHIEGLRLFNPFDLPHAR